MFDPEQQKFIISSMVLLIINGVALLTYHHTNPNLDMERFFMHEQPFFYYLAKLAYTTLWIAFAFNARYLVHTMFRLGAQNIFAFALKKLKIIQK